MHAPITSIKVGFAGILALCLLAAAGFGAPRSMTAEVIVENAGGLATIRGVVRDESGGPISAATVAVFRVGTSQLLRQVETAANGSYVAKIWPGTYTILAVAQGFNPVTLASVKLNGSTDMDYGFRLERAGGGNTLPEKRADRNSSKWRIRAAKMQRSIYQNTDGKAPVDETAANDAESEPAEKSTLSKPQAVVETYFASNDAGTSKGVNFATLVPVSARTSIVVAGEYSPDENTARRLESIVNFRANASHNLSLRASATKLGNVRLGNSGRRGLGQISVAGYDQWQVTKGLILVLGFDYSRFAGAGSDSSLLPRVGVQFDLSPKTRLKAAFTPQTETRNWADVASFEDLDIAFSEPVGVEDVVVQDNAPRMDRSTRLEFGIERILDSRSSVDTGIFLDTSLVHGVGLSQLPFNTLDPASFDDLVANQAGRAAGVRVVYTRRIAGGITASAGYAFGTGQKLSAETLSDPSNFFRSSLFQTVYGEVAADFDTGTHVQTIYRLSPEATVFAIDPFKGRLAIYDPGLSVLITQRLPRFGLPLRAEAVIDARNLFDIQSGVSGLDRFIRMDGTGRGLRGGIMVRF